jgi:hypothetical protein
LRLASFPDTPDVCGEASWNLLFWKISPSAWCLRFSAPFLDIFMWSTNLSLTIKA